MEGGARGDPVSITLSPLQVQEVLHAAASGPPGGMASLAVDSMPLPDADAIDPRLSRSLVRGLSILASFGPDARERGIVELAHELHMSPSTAHRYAQTLVQIGLLERCPSSRKYRLPKR